MSSTATGPNTHTKDGQVILINAPAYSVDDAEIIASSNADGIGLLSTDFMYMDRDGLPDEEEQLATLLRVSRLMGGRPVTVRLLQAPPSMITALGNAGLPDDCRGVRLGLARPDILETQLRAIVRACAEGNFRLLLPMVADVAEVIKVKDIIRTIHHDFAARNIHCSSPDLGVELEVPAAVVMASVLSFEVSFFSVSKKLQQHTLMAKEGGYSGNNDLLHHYAPSFLFQISNLAGAVRKRRKSLAVTAPLAGLLPAIPLLVAMGVNELVMPPKRMEQARQIIARLTMPRAKLTASKAMSFWSPDEIQRYAEESLSRLIPYPAPGAANNLL
ncbi:putative PEP-binding protein [Desulfallas thermosapovorans]|uniref:Phosphotransferase system enzyme I (PtsI) n=1 Tax=Desulfallas thermosapovorans DSM 6562 TaxID=1121431 RepID=A0A5S4ZQ07_9FIRM|nr:putative PEP-binding protein [Desulfallas thermosapovorans]TYO94680.1 phosphotransferase system enzyme I (PtsI) [Desulfallas thermosapovorans DSM 6562]